MLFYFKSKQGKRKSKCGPAGYWQKAACSVLYRGERQTRVPAYRSLSLTEGSLKEVRPARRASRWGRPCLKREPGNLAWPAPSSVVGSLLPFREGSVGDGRGPLEGSGLGKVVAEQRGAIKSALTRSKSCRRRYLGTWLTEGPGRVCNNNYLNLRQIYAEIVFWDLIAALSSSNVGSRKCGI